jgi:hypothetical protein
MCVSFSWFICGPFVHNVWSSLHNAYMRLFRSMLVSTIRTGHRLLYPSVPGIILSFIESRLETPQIYCHSWRKTLTPVHDPSPVRSMIYDWWLSVIKRPLWPVLDYIIEWQPFIEASGNPQTYNSWKTHNAYCLSDRRGKMVLQPQKEGRQLFSMTAATAARMENDSPRWNNKTEEAEWARLHFYWLAARTFI